jgi:hypothetical protein
MGWAVVVVIACSPRGVRASARDADARFPAVALDQLGALTELFALLALIAR